MLTDIPHKMPASVDSIFDSIGADFFETLGPEFFDKYNESPTDALIYLKSLDISENGDSIIGVEDFINFFDAIVKEKFELKFEDRSNILNIMKSFYKKGEDGSYTLDMNTQSFPKLTQAIRNILGKYRELFILTPEKAHQLFGGFILKYDADFRNFLLANIDEMSPELQKQMRDGKVILDNLNQYKYSPKTKDEMMSMYSFMFEEEAPVVENSSSDDTNNVDSNVVQDTLEKCKSK